MRSTHSIWPEKVSKKRFKDVFLSYIQVYVYIIDTKKDLTKTFYNIYLLKNIKHL